MIKANGLNNIGFDRLVLQLNKRNHPQVHLLMLLYQLIRQLTYQLHCLKTKSKSPIQDSMSYVCCVIAVVPTEKNNGASEASLNTPSESVDESIDEATFANVLVDAFS